MSIINLKVESQGSPVADEVSALIAAVRPILQGLLFALKKDVVDQCGGLDQLKLFMLPRVYRPGFGDCGICFEYAAHDAINRNEPSVIERITDSLKKFCKVPGSQPASILFGAEKTGALQTLGTPLSFLTDESRVLTGVQSQPPKLKQHIGTLTDAFRRSSQRELLPSSISGLWKADLFVGNRDTDRWVGATVKINPSHLEGASGLRIGIIPSTQGSSDAISFDGRKNLVICPLPYDGAFSEIFYSAWVLVKSFIAADAKVPPPSSLPRGADRMVAQLLEQRREFSVLEVIAFLEELAQPQLINTRIVSGTSEIETQTSQDVVNTVIAPSPFLISNP